MLKRTLELKLTKPSKKEDNSDEDVQTADPVDYMQIVCETAKIVGSYVVLGVGSYVVLDTFRQVLIKVTPQH